MQCLVNKHRDSPASTGKCVSIHTKEDFLVSRPYTWTLYQRKTNSQFGILRCGEGDVGGSQRAPLGFQAAREKRVKNMISTNCREGEQGMKSTKL